VLETALGKSQWLAGSEFSVADLNAAAAMVRALSFDLGKWPKVHAWLHRCWDRPAGQKALAMRQ
jgi:glutathione S-transferase